MQLPFKTWSLLTVAILVLFMVGIPIYRLFMRGHKWQEQAVRFYQELPKKFPTARILGTSNNGHPIYALELGSGEERVLIVAAVHGDEPLSVLLLQEWLKELIPVDKKLPVRVIIIPVLNPDGLLAGARTNGAGVDLNRNFPATNWTPVYEKDRYFPGVEPTSEKETQLLLSLIESYRPDRILALHSDLTMNNYNGPAGHLAEAMARFNGYPVTDQLEYSTPGSLGSYAGDELRIPVVTLELPRQNIDKLWKQNQEALACFLTGKESWGKFGD